MRLYVFLALEERRALVAGLLQQKWQRKHLKTFVKTPRETHAAIRVVNGPRGFLLILAFAQIGKTVHGELVGIV